MMPPVHRHPRVDHVRHLHRTVAAAGAIDEAITGHAEAERLRRLQDAERRQAEAKLQQVTAPSRDTLQSRPAIR